MIARKSMLIVIAQFSTQFIGWAGMVVLAKLWGDFAPQALGSIGFAISFVALFNFIADLGFGSAHVKRISEGNDIGVCIGTYATIKIFLTVVVVTLVFISIFIMKFVFHTGFSDATTESMIFIFVIYYIFSNLSSIPLFTFSGTKEMAKREIPGVISRTVKVVLGVIIALAGVTGIVMISPAIEWPEFLHPIQEFFASHAAGAYAMTYVVDMLIIFLIGMWFLRKYPIKKPNLLSIKSYFSFSLPLMFLSAVSIISVNITKVMIGYFWTSIEVGYYFAIQQITAFLTILYTAVGSLLFPAFSEYHSNKERDKVRDTAHLAERYISMIMIPPVIAIIVLAEPVILIMLDKAFLPAISVLTVLVLYTFIQSMNEPHADLITGMNKPGLISRIGFTMCMSNIILNYLFIPKNGLLSNIAFGSYSISINGPTGAAVATLLSTLIGFFYLRYSAHELAGTSFFQSHTPRHIIAGIIMGGVLYYISTFLPIIRFYHLLIFAVLGTAVYIGILFILKEFNKEDMRFFLAS